MDETPRVSPHSRAAEIAVLGSILLDQDAIKNPALSRLKPQDFYFEQHRHIWRAALSLRDSGAPIDLTLLSEELRRTGQLDEAGGLNYLIGLAEEVPTSAHAEHYARIVSEKSYLRGLIRWNGQLMRHAYEQDMALEDLAALTSQPPALELGIKRTVSVADSITEVLAQADAGSGPKGVPTGLDDFDALTGGLEPGRFYVLAARPGMGKSGLAFQIGAHVAMTCGRVLGFSLEMGAQEIAARVLASEARVDLKSFSRARRGDRAALNGRSWERLTYAQSKLALTDFDILPKPSLKLQELIDEVRAEHERLPLKLFILDYLQLVQLTGRAGDNPVQRVTAITTALKALAMELQIPVLALSQLSRAVEQRPNHRPMLSDLRESGSVEQDADVVFFIYRDEYYNSKTDQQGIAELIVGKQRNGPLDTVKVQFHAAFVRFQNLAAEFYGSAAAD